MTDAATVAAPFPRFIEIQTTAACNAACVVCPHPQISSEQPRRRMDADLFRSIVDQCVDHQHGMTMIPYLNAEPLLDVRLPKRLDYIRRTCPAATIELSTNMSMLDARWRRALTRCRIDDLRLSVFGFTAATHGALMPGLNFERVMANLAEMAADREFVSSVGKIGVVLLRHPALTEQDRVRAEEFCADNGFALYRWGVLDRSRNVAGFSNEIHRTVVTGCEQRRHLERLHIRVDGSVVLCCQDWRAEVVMGNVRDTRINELWHGPEYQRVRADIASGMPGAAPELCTRCKISVGT